MLAGRCPETGHTGILRFDNMIWGSGIGFGGNAEPLVPTRPHTLRHARTGHRARGARESGSVFIHRPTQAGLTADAFPCPPSARPAVANR